MIRHAEEVMTYVESVEHGNTLEQRLVHLTFVECVLEDDTSECRAVLQSDRHTQQSVFHTTSDSQTN